MFCYRDQIKFLCCTGNPLLFGRPVFIIPTYRQSLVLCWNLLVVCFYQVVHLPLGLWWGLRSPCFSYLCTLRFCSHDEKKSNAYKRERERDRAHMKLRQCVSANLLLAEYNCLTVKCIEAYTDSQYSSNWNLLMQLN